MSSKKVYVSVGVGEELLKKIEEVAEHDQRSRSAMMERILKEYFLLLEGKKESQDANQP